MNRNWYEPNRSEPEPVFGSQSMLKMVVVDEIITFFMIFLCLKIENGPKNKNRKKSGRKKFKKTKILKKRTRGNCEAEAFQCQQKTFKKPSAAPGNFEKPLKNHPAAPQNPQKTLPGDIFEGFGQGKLTEGGARASARAPFGGF